MDVTSKTEGKAFADAKGVPLLVKYDTRLRQQQARDVTEDVSEAVTVGQICSIYRQMLSIELNSGHRTHLSARRFCVTNQALAYMRSFNIGFLLVPLCQAQHSEALLSP